MRVREASRRVFNTLDGLRLVPRVTFFIVLLDFRDRCEEDGETVPCQHRHIVRAPNPRDHLSS
jgi:hypothetical protein